MTAPADDYIMGRTSAEYRRLRVQALGWAEATRRVLRQAGLGEGMSCLDIGCGPGEAMRLMREIAGPAACVTGVDVDGALGREALDVLRATAGGTFAFHELDVETAEEVPGGPFDVVFARILLVHLREPQSGLRKMMRWTRPGGVVVVQEYDFAVWDVLPRLDEAAEAIGTFCAVVERTGHDPRIGFRLPACFAEAGLGPPDGTDVTALLQELSSGGLMLQEVYNSVFPMAVRLGLADEADRLRIFSAIDTAIQAGGYHMMSPLLVGAWKRRPREGTVGIGD